MKDENKIKPNPDMKPGDGGPNRCAFDALLWIVVVLLMLSFGVLVTTGAILSVKGFAAPVFSAFVAAGVFCALVLAMLLIAYFALSIQRLCCGTHFKEHFDPGHIKLHKSIEE